MFQEFSNEPITDFAADEAARTAQQAAIETYAPVDCPLVINGKRIKTPKKLVSVNPCEPSKIVGRASRASRAQADKAIRTAHGTFGAWAATPPERRAEIIATAAGIMRERRWELNATMILEASKSWVEADADTAEAIDFCEYYAREMIRLSTPPALTPVAGERNRMEYLPLGVGVVISPWNFPCAILTGMTAAALVTGNPVVMKPASVTPVIAFKVFEILEEAGVPPGVLNFLPCSGGEVGDSLVDHPLTRFISFTGSKEVGIRIYERAAKVGKGQIWLKRVVAEMGGKDAIIVDEDADFDAAAAGIVASAFGYQGQKCSACSRAILVGRAYDAVLEKVREKTSDLRVGNVRSMRAQVGAVIDEKQMKKILKYTQLGRREGKLVAGGRRAPGKGYFILPTVFANVKEKARIAREEIFGPVLALLRARSYDDAIRIANSTEYGLTGAYYGSRVEQAAREFHVGNLYMNRKCTGALVGGHPFGGFNMSGTNSKAGGPDYLRLFLEAKVIVEKVV